MRCPGCQFVCSDENDICPKCLFDLRDEKREQGIKITNPKDRYESLVMAALGKSTPANRGLLGSLTRWTRGMFTSSAKRKTATRKPSDQSLKPPYARNPVRPKTATRERLTGRPSPKPKNRKMPSSDNIQGEQPLSSELASTPIPAAKPEVTATARPTEPKVTTTPAQKPSPTIAPQIPPRQSSPPSQAPETKPRQYSRTKTKETLVTPGEFESAPNEPTGRSETIGTFDIDEKIDLEKLKDSATVAAVDTIQNLKTEVSFDAVLPKQNVVAARSDSAIPAKGPEERAISDTTESAPASGWAHFLKRLTSEENEERLFKGSAPETDADLATPEAPPAIVTDSTEPAAEGFGVREDLSQIAAEPSVAAETAPSYRTSDIYRSNVPTSDLSEQPIAITAQHAEPVSPETFIVEMPSDTEDLLADEPEHDQSSPNLNFSDDSSTSDDQEFAFEMIAEESPADPTPISTASGLNEVPTTQRRILPASDLEALIAESLNALGVTDQEADSSSEIQQARAETPTVGSKSETVSAMEPPAVETNSPIKPPVQFTTNTPKITAAPSSPINSNPDDSTPLGRAPAVGKSSEPKLAQPTMKPVTKVAAPTSPPLGDSIAKLSNADKLPKAPITASLSTSIEKASTKSTHVAPLIPANLSALFQEAFDTISTAGGSAADLEIGSDLFTKFENRDAVVILFDLAEESIIDPEAELRYDKAVPIAAADRIIESELVTKQLEEAEKALSQTVLALRGRKLKSRTASTEKQADSAGSFSFADLERPTLFQRLSAFGADLIAILLFSVVTVLSYIWLAEPALLAGLNSKDIFIRTEVITLIAGCSVLYLIALPLLSSLFIGRTLGMLVFNQYLISTNGELPKFKRAFVRYATFPFSIALAGFLPILGGANPMHDHLAGTLLINMPDDSEPLEDSELVT